MIRRLSLILAVCSAICASARFARADDVDDIVKASMSSQRVPGVAIAVVKDGRVIKSAGYGSTDLQSAAPVTPDTVFRIQSMTKQFTAAGIMLLVEDGKIALDDPIGKYLDPAPPRWEQITIRHLLTQTSGLKDFINEPALDLHNNLTDQQILESTAARELNSPPGQVWQYSNTNYHLLAMIIRKVSGSWYGDFLSERIFKPLEMTRTAVAADAESIPNYARGYSVENGQVRASSTDAVAPAVSSYGGGGIRTTVLDLVKWDAALDGDRLLKRSTLEQMWTPVRLAGGTTHGYGFGWEIDTIANHRLICHGGNWLGYSSQIDRFVDDHLTVIVLTNLFNAPASKVARAVAGTYLPAVAPPVYKPIDDNQPQITARLRDVLNRSAAGTLTPDDMAPGTWPYFAPYVDQLKKDLTALGPLQQLTLVERTDQAPNRSLRYQARFSRTTLIFHFVIDQDAKIVTMMPEEVNQ